MACCMIINTLKLKSLADETFKGISKYFAWLLVIRRQLTFVPNDLIGNKTNLGRWFM